MEKDGQKESRTVQERLKQEIRMELQGISQIEEENLQECIDRAIRREGQRQYLPLQRRLELKTRLYDSFRRLDILQELVDDPEDGDYGQWKRSDFCGEKRENQPMGTDI